MQVEGVQWRPKDAYEAAHALEQVTERLREQGDGARAVFLDIYLVVTRRVVELLGAEGAGGFLEPQWLARLTGRFAEEALMALLKDLQQQPQPSAAWRMASRYAAMPATLPCQNALLGVNAHINHDLGMVVYEDLCLGESPVETAQLWRYEHDFFHVNEILWDSILPSLELLCERYGCPLTRQLAAVPGSRRLLRYAVMALLRRWRARVWREFLAMRRAPTPQARQALAHRMDRRSGRIGWVLGSGGALQRVLRLGASLRNARAQSPLSLEGSAPRATREL